MFPPPTSSGVDVSALLAKIGLQVNDTNETVRGAVNLGYEEDEVGWKVNIHSNHLLSLPDPLRHQ